MLLGQNTSSTSLLIDWIPPPVLQQNGIITGYHIEWKILCLNTSANESLSRIDVVYIPLCSFTQYLITNSTDPKDTSFLIYGLRPLTNYEITISANTSAGGGPSVTIIAITDQDGK